MKQRHSFPISVLRGFSAASLILGLLLFAAAPSRGDDLSERRSQAHDQFTRAEGMRADLEAKSERQRSLKEYQQLISAYRRVYLITPNAVEVPGAIKEVGDLYRMMGQQFEPMYFDSAVETYEYLIHEYPQSSLRDETELAIAKIQRNNLGQTNLAQKTYQDFLAQHPHSSHADEARKALAEIQADDRVETVKTLPPPPPPPSPAIPAGTPTSAAGTAGMTPPDTSNVGQVRVWNADTYTRIIIPLGGQAKYQTARISDPDRIYFDISGAKLGAKLSEPVDVPSGGYLKAIRMAQNSQDVVRVVLEVSKVKDYSVFELSNPDRLVVDVYGPDADRAPGSSLAAKRIPLGPALTAGKSAASTSSAANTDNLTDAPAATPTTPAHKAAKNSSSSLTARADSPSLNTTDAVQNARESGSSPSGSLREVKATKPGPASPSGADAVPTLSARKTAEATGPAPIPEPTHSGEQSLTRALGLKIGRIVIDAGHGGHDTGTIGANGLMEKDLCLDLALRVGKLIETRLPGADVVYTRSDDTFVPLEQRTALANSSKADLFLSIHANSSDDPHVSGIETYYLNFNASPGAMDVAARENATAQSNVHDLEDIVEKIARNEKIEESRDFATDIQDALAKQAGSTERSRGVRKAPFVVLIGADMPSVLAEVSFLSNPAQEQWLKKPDNRQRIAEGLYRGIEIYLHSTNSLASAANPAPTAQPIAVARTDSR
jgi:N-acetylmuramoyl-L-alanine amidase